MYYYRSKADLCLFYYWYMHVLVLAICWVDNVLAMNNEKSLEHLIWILKDCIGYEETEGLNEYLGYKTNQNKDRLKITQPVLVQLLKDKFDLEEVTSRNVPVEAGKVLVCNRESKISEKAIKYYRKSVGKLLHIICFSRLERVSITRELSNFMTEETSLVYLQAILEEMKYIVSILERD